MELGLSLGDASKTVGFLKESKSSSAVQDPKPTGFNFCMALGLNSSPAPSKPHKPQLATDPDDDDDDDDDDDPDHLSHGDDESDDPHHHHHHPAKNPTLQLNLLPLVPVKIASHLPWSSDNGSSENGSSAAAAARRVDVNRVPGEEVSSTGNSQMDFNLELMGGGGGKKRSTTSAEEDELDENALNAARKKLRLSKQQSAFLEESFKEHHTLNPKQKQALAKELSLRPRQVEVWFQNRRARTKLKQTEVDCEYLKRCCDTLTEENRRLHKELQELRSLNKNTNPFYIQPPATTLTMCPSCERVIAARPTTFYPAPPPS